MKYLKKFNEMQMSDLGEDIAKDLFPIFMDMRAKGEKITADIFDQYMKERGADLNLSDSVLNHLVNMGLDLDLESPEEIGEEPFLK